MPARRLFVNLRGLQNSAFLKSRSDELQSDWAAQRMRNRSIHLALEAGEIKRDGKKCEKVSSAIL